MANMTDVAATRRRWVQFALWEFVVVTSLLGVVWATAATQLVNEPVYLLDWPFLRMVPNAYRPPTESDIAYRGILGSAALVGVWFIARTIVCLLYDWRAAWRTRRASTMVPCDRSS